MNPEAARMHDSAPKSGGLPKIAKPGEHEDGGDKGHIELHHGPNPDDGKGKFHTIAHPSGEKRGHESMHDAHHAQNEHMGEDGCKGEGCAEHGGEAAGAQDMSGSTPIGDEAY